jgi:Uma2 family endonuclease
LIEALGDIPGERVRLDPPPGQATEKDLLQVSARADRLYELVDGTLVEKVMGWKEASLAIWLARLMHPYLMQNDIGDLIGADGSHRLRKGLIRLPDLAFVLWENIPAGDAPQIVDMAPDLAVEVISPSKDSKGNGSQRQEYFRAGTQLVWHIYPNRKEVEVYTSPTRPRTLRMGDALDGGDLLPGFRLPLSELFAERGGRKKGTTRRRKPKG